MGKKLNKNQKRKKKVQAKKKAHLNQQQNEDRAWKNKFNAERLVARNKIREGYREAGMPEEQIERLVPKKDDQI
jgi:hypothetical protein